jgi:glycosyltransferase involved in cell wall biosynthesis
MECLESTINTGYSQLEIILVDDCSTDNSHEIVSHFIDKESTDSVQFIHLKNDSNRGISYSKNQGMKVMNGEFFFFTGSDDVVLPNRISEPISYLEMNPEVEIVYSDIEIWQQTTGKKVKRGFPEEMTNQNAFLYQLKRSYLWSGVLFARRSATLEFDDTLSSAVDYEWYFRHFLKGTNIHFINSSLASYRMHSRNSSKNLSKSKKNVCDILRKFDFNDAYRLFCNDSNIDNNEVNLSFAWYHFTIGEFQEALRKIAHLNPSFEKKFLEGLVFAYMKNYTKAYECFSHIYQENPEIPESLNNMSVCMVFNSENNNTVKKHLMRATQLNPNYLDARANLELVKKTNFNHLKLKITDRPLRKILTHIDNYN